LQNSNDNVLPKIILNAFFLKIQIQQ